MDAKLEPHLPLITDHCPLFLLHNGVVAVIEQLLPHDIRIVAIHKRTSLHVNKIVAHIATRRNCIASLAERIYQDLRILGMRNCSNLHHPALHLRHRRLHAEGGGGLRASRLAAKSRVYRRIKCSPDLSLG